MLFCARPTLNAACACPDRLCAWYGCALLDVRECACDVLISVRQNIKHAVLANYMRRVPGMALHSPATAAVCSAAS
eukprot:5539762-Pleurochrysis_carterae.AAC.1